MTSLKSLLALALVVSLSAHQVSAEAIQLNERSLAHTGDGTSPLSDRAVAAFTDVASFMEAEKIAVPQKLRVVFEQI
ncbi:hypothetical protein FJ365_06200, partial [Candidatus Dependentiae bacterium]|nr:hypothetical protein [Candidatus Dependentiae bacterium]